MAQPSLDVRFEGASEQRFPLTSEQLAELRAVWDAAPDESADVKPVIRDALNVVEPGLGEQFMAATSGRITIHTGRFLSSPQGFSWKD